jgi:hypothetical protein
MNYKIEMNFYRDWIEHLKERLIEAGYSPTNKQDDVGLQYFNLVRRLIKPMPRKIHISREFECPVEHQPGLELVKQKIEVGENLQPYLSTRLVDLDYDDDLLNDWGIHHLHLGTNFRKDGFVKRTGPVLFARFENDAAYLINVMKHGNWSNQDMIRIIHENWPESIKKFRMMGVSGMGQTLTDKDIKKLRQAHVITFIEPELGVVYGPPGLGLTTSGTGLEVVRTSFFYARKIKGFENIVKNGIDEIAALVKKEGIELGENLSFILKIEESKVSAIEQNFNVIIELGKLD